MKQLAILILGTAFYLFTMGWLMDEDYKHTSKTEIKDTLTLKQN